MIEQTNHPSQGPFGELPQGAPSTMPSHLPIAMSALAAGEVGTEEVIPDLSVYEPDRQSNHIVKWSVRSETLGLMGSGRKRWRIDGDSVWEAFW